MSTSFLELIFYFIFYFSWSSLCVQNLEFLSIKEVIRDDVNIEEKMRFLLTKKQQF